MKILPSSPSTATGRGDGGIVVVSPRSRRSRSVGMSSPPPFVASYEWVRDDVLKYHSSITSTANVAALEC